MRRASGERLEKRSVRLAGQVPLKGATDPPKDSVVLLRHRGRSFRGGPGGTARACASRASWGTPQSDSAQAGTGSKALACYGGSLRVSGLRLSSRGTGSEALAPPQVCATRSSLCGSSPRSPLRIACSGRLRRRSEPTCTTASRSSGMPGVSPWTPSRHAPPRALPTAVRTTGLCSPRHPPLHLVTASPI